VRISILLLMVILAVAAISCDQVDELVDVTPPPEPEPFLISVSGPDAQGRLTVTGENSSVEDNVTVLASNLTGGSSGQGESNAQGAFSLQLAGEFFDSIQLRARDEAGNTSTSIILQAGSPFSLSGLTGGGQEAVIGTAFADSVKFKIVDSGAMPVIGARIVYNYDASAGDAVASFSPDTAISDQDGIVASEVTLGNIAGSLVIAPSGLTPGGEVIDFASAGVLELTATPAEADTLVLVSGSGQKDGPGQTLSSPLVIEARDIWGNPVPGTSLAYTPSGDGGVYPPAGITGASGQASMIWTLAGTLGLQTLTVTSGSLEPLAGNAVADDPPTISSVSPTTPVDAGDMVTLFGDNFCAEGEFNTLTLGGLAMEVVSATEIQINARIPWGLGEGTHDLILTVGHQTAPESFSFTLNPPPATVFDYPFTNGEVSVEISVPSQSTRYLVVPYSLKRTGPWVYDPFNFGIAGGTGDKSSERSAVESDPVADFYRRLLTPPSAPLPPAVDRGGDRDLADRESFLCLSNPVGNVYDAGSYTTVTATLKYTGNNVMLYVDDNTPVDNLPQDKINELGDRFDDHDHGIDVAAFGQETDIDGNDRVMVLLSPIVNAMSDHPSVPAGAYIGGFFNSADLNAFGEVPGTSNAGEIFYSLIPDPYAEFSQVTHPVESTVQEIKAVLAHEFQHMINHGRRHCSAADGGNGYSWEQGERLWLNEGLSHLAEDLCGYHDSNRGRVGLFLHGEATRLASLEYVEEGDGYNESGNALSERGAAYLFCRYIEDRWPLVARDLIGGPASGADNVALATGQDFDQLFKDWAAAIYLDDRDLDGDGSPEDLGPIYRFTSHNIRVDFPPQGPLDEPLSIETVYFDNPVYGKSLFASTVHYLHLAVHATEDPPPGGTITLDFSGPAAGEMGILLLRVHN
jgi:hypothetical protein